jgi:amino acid adenylation domain-containing protein
MFMLSSCSVYELASQRSKKADVKNMGEACLNTMSIRIDSSEAGSSGDQWILDLPLDHRRSSGRSSQTLAESAVVIPPDLARQLAVWAKRENLSLSSVYLATYAVLLSRYGNTSEVNVASSITLPSPDCRSRNHGRVTSIQTNCSPELSIREFLHTVAESIASGEQHSKQTAHASTSCRAAFIWRDIQRWENIRPVRRTVSRAATRSPLREQFDVTFEVQCYLNFSEAALLYRPDLFEPDTIKRISCHLARLFEQIVNNPEASLAELDMMPEEERALVLGLYAGSSSDYPQACLHELFAEQVALRPHAEAVVYGGERLTYRQLDLRSNQVAQFLLSEKICPEDRVGVFMDRSADMIVAILGILKAGGTYVPIDVDYPLEQLRFIAADTALRLVLTQCRVSAIFPAGAHSFFVDTPDSPIRRCGDEPVGNRSTPESIAVVNYTSGSTGQPKAARIPHRAIIRTVRDTNYVQTLPEDCVAQASSPSFDAAIQEIWLALVNGATVVGLRPETLLSPAELKPFLRDEKISILVINTSYVHQIARDAPGILKGIRKVLFGGEAAEPGPLRELLKHVGPGVLVNGYGPAEGCVTTTYYEITNIPADATTVPIGRPVSNARVYLLDHLQRPVPIGIQGEIYIGGDGVARGYLNRPELTAERFLPDTLSGKSGGLLYRTGDFARMRGNGELEFRGRADEQVKIRGHRIELAEVRQAIAAHPEVKQVFLMVREDHPGDKRLFAYVTLRRPTPAAQELLRQHTKNKLPAHMLPAAFVVVDSIPLTTNGKVDRKKLPAPDYRPKLGHSHSAADDDFETILTHLWQELLQMDNLGLDANFFDLGGHSLLAARLIARIERQTGNNIPMATLFEAPTIAKLADRLRRHTYESAWSPLVELHVPTEIATAKPFFCVHSLGANLVSFHKVAALMRGDRPIYGLQPHGLDGRQEPLGTIEEMASAYLQEIRKKQLHGPYYLGGICLGGVIAYEIAQQLQAAGETVALTVLIDSYLPGKMKHLHERSPLALYVDRHIGEMFLLPGMARLKYVARWLANGGIRFGRLVGVRDRSSLARATGKVATAHRRAILSYRAKSFAGKIVQLMCSDAAHRAYEDSRLAWSSLASTGFEIRIIPGNHLTMVEEPHAQTLAEELQGCLDREAASRTLVDDRPAFQYTLADCG